MPVPTGEPGAARRGPSTHSDLYNLYGVSSPRRAHMMKFISADNGDFSRVLAAVARLGCPFCVVVGMCAGVDGGADE